jgi:sugar lactone lactonase YvrE
VRRVTIVLLSLAAMGCAGASAADRVTVRLASRPAAVTVGTPWTARLVVTPASGGRPLLVARGGARTRTFRATPQGSGRYRARVVLPAPGRWRLEARLRGRTHRLGFVVARTPVPAAEVEEPFSVAVGADGSVLVADRAADRIWRIRPGSAERTVVAEVAEPLDVAVGPGGDVYVVSEYRVRRIAAATGAVATVAGTGANSYSGDGGPATSAALHSPDSVAFDGAGNLYVAEYENRIRRVDAATGTISTVAGTGAEGFGGDGGPATRALIGHPHGLAVAADGTMLIADTWNQRIRRVDPSGVITTVAGTGAEGDGGDGGPASRAVFNDPVHVALGPDGSLYVSDGSNQRVRRIGPDGVIRTVAGSGLAGSSGDGGAATRATLNLPNSVAVAPDGTFYIAEFEGRRVRRVDGATGVITTIAR